MSSPASGAPVALDSVDYNPIDHLNLLFTNASSISSIALVSESLQSRQDELSSRISSLEAAQAYSSDSTLSRMRSAQADLGLLFSKIETIRSRAIGTEQSITAMTADIKRLDATKRNLTLSMTALKRLQMLTTAYEQLRGLSKTRQYRDCAGLLQAVLQLMRHFNSYRSIEQIATLSRGVSDLQRELLEQVCEDFEMAFAKDEAGARRGTLVEACLVMDALGETARARLMTWYVNTQLREYRQVFRGNDEAGSLDNIGRRYAWFKRMMRTHEDEHAAIFPPHWRANEALASAFCDGTRDDFKGILERSARRTDAARLDVDLLLSCLQETLDFEQHVERRVTNELPRASIDTMSSAEERAHSFNGSISAAFEPYLSLWVEAQDRQLAATIPKYRGQPLVAPDEDFSPQAVIPSAIELFHFYKLTLSQCAKLSTGERLLDLSRTLARYLDEYAQQVLLHVLQTVQAAGGVQGPAAGGVPPLQSVVLVLNTADFWHANTNQLEDNIKKRIDGEWAGRVDLSSQADAFMGVASAAVLALVRTVGQACEGAWREMKNSNWSTLESAGDQSSYVGELLGAVRDRSAQVLALVAKQQYARAFCDNLVEHMAAAYVATLVQCRPISEVGAEQMLLDKYVITKALEGLLGYYHHHQAVVGQNHRSPSSSSAGGGGGTPGSPTLTIGPTPPTYVPPAGFIKRVNQSMSRIDPLLKTLQVRTSPPEALVQAYLIHIGDRSDANFRKVLDLKGVRKTDQARLVELFGVHRDGGKQALVQNSALMTPLVVGGAVGGVGGGGGLGAGSGGGIAGVGGLAGMSIGMTNASAALSGAAGLQGLQGRFDAAFLGEKLLSAAREMGAGGGGGGSVRGTGAGAGNGSGNGPGAGSGEKATINENLKTIGNFFRRDIRGLGARFGKRDTSAGEGG